MDCINMLTKKTRKQKIIGGSFKSFITADDNPERGKSGKGIDVKLEKDRSGNPTAWLIGGDALWDEPFEELKKGAKGGRYKKFIDELMKTYPRFNNFTQPDVHKGIKLTHAMFCKLFMPDSVLGRLYPDMVKKLKQLRHCPYKNVALVQRPQSQRQAIPVIPAIQRQAIPVIPAIQRQAIPVIPAIQRQAIPVIPAIQRQSVHHPIVSPRPQSPRPQSPRQSVHRLIVSQRPRQNKIQFQTRRRHHAVASAIQRNLKILTDMGFNNASQMTDALMKHNNNIERAIHELTMSKSSQTLQSITRDERFNAYDVLTTTIELQNLTARKNFIIQDNGGAGDCLFLSLHDTLTRLNPFITQNKTAHDIRLEIVDFIMQNLNQPQNQTTRQTFENTIHHGVVVNGKTLHLHNYAHEMSNQYTHGTELEISAAAQLYKMNIYVVNRNGVSFDQLYIGNGRPTWRNTWYIFNINNVHYTSLICIDGPDNCPPGDM